MKRTATTLALLAGFGGGCVSPDGAGKKPVPQGGFGTVTRPMTAPGVTGPSGEPVALTAARGATPGAAPSQTVTQAAGVRPVGFRKAAGPATSAVIPGVYRDTTGGSGIMQAQYGGPPPFDPTCPPGMPGMPGGQGKPMPGILPVPGMGPPGAVAAVGAMVPGMQPAVTNMRSSVRFLGPREMKVTWQLPTRAFTDLASGLQVGQDYNFLQGQVYRLRLTGIIAEQALAGRTFYPTLEVAPATPKTITFLSHSTIPVGFTIEDFQQAASGNLVVKVIYLPDPLFQDFAVVGAAEEIVSTRLEPGADPVAEAQRRGTVLAIVRMGNIDLENGVSPKMTDVPAPVPPPGFGPPPGAGGPGMWVPPGAGAPGGGGPLPPLPPVPGAGMGTVPPGVPPAPPPPGIGAVPGGPVAPTPLPSGVVGASATVKPTTSKPRLLPFLK